jgi:hypothetical protein
MAEVHRGISYREPKEKKRRRQQSSTVYTFAAIPYSQFMHVVTLLPMLFINIITIIAKLASATNPTVIVSVVQVLYFSLVGNGMPTVYDGPSPDYNCPKLVIFPSISVTFKLSVVV